MGRAEGTVAADSPAGEKVSLPARRAQQRDWVYLPEFAQEHPPRYTSYPPADRFSASVDGRAAEAALRALDPDARLSIYLHMPFCKKRCRYCGCQTGHPTPSGPVEPYLDALKAEIDRVARLLPGGVKVSRIDFGGGFPDVLRPAQIADLFSVMTDRLAIESGAQIAAELDPQNLSAPVIDAFAAAGLGRASLGVQVLDPSVQKRINRIQSREMVETAIARLRAAGVKDVNIDIMYGLPGQTRSHVIETAMFAATQDVNRAAVVGYAHPPWMKTHQKGVREPDLPGGEERFRQAEAASATLERFGYLPVGFDQFAAPGDSLVLAEREGRLRRNFQGYTEDGATALIGFGASAISSLPGLIYQNASDRAAYRAAMSGGRSAVARGALLGVDDRRIASLIERILCDFEADVPADLPVAADADLVRLANAGLIELRGSRLTVTSRGRPYVRNIAARFDPGQAPAVRLHSLAG